MSRKLKNVKMSAVCLSVSRTLIICLCLVMPFPIGCTDKQVINGPSYSHTPQDDPYAQPSGATVSSSGYDGSGYVGAASSGSKKGVSAIPSSTAYADTVSITDNASKPAGNASQVGTRGTTPYTVLGQTYYPLLSAEGYSEEGLASWYGKDFHGKQTASGERYDMYAMTAAHKVLPFGTKVKVTSLENGNSVVVRINDRGPFVGNRIIDLSQSGAEQLDMVGPGTARVRIETVGSVAGLEDGVLKGKFYVQVGAFSKEANATVLVQTLKERGYNARHVYLSNIGFWRVQVGPYEELSKVEDISDKLKVEFPNNFILAD